LPLKEKNLFLLVVFLIFGVIISIQFRSTLSANRESASVRLDIDRVIKEIEAEKALQNELERQIKENVRIKEDIIEAYMKNRDDTLLVDAWDKIKIDAGLTGVKGRGITIKLDDADPKQDGDPLDLIIHDQDVKIILNELKKAGAQAIAINRERLTPMSEQICAGPTILINRNRYVVPFVIDAIGDPDTLFEAVDKSERVVLMRYDKVRVEIKKSDEIIIPKYRDIDHGDLINSISGLEAVKNENK